MVSLKNEICLQTEQVKKKMMQTVVILNIRHFAKSDVDSDE